MFVVPYIPSWLENNGFFYLNQPDEVEAARVFHPLSSQSLVTMWRRRPGLFACTLACAWVSASSFAPQPSRSLARPRPRAPSHSTTTAFRSTAERVEHEPPTSRSTASLAAAAAAAAATPSSAAFAAAAASPEFAALRATELRELLRRRGEDQLAGLTKPRLLERLQASLAREAETKRSAALEAAT